MSRINLKESTMVRPASQTPHRSLWISNIDLAMTRIHVPYIYFYTPNINSPNFFDAATLKRALSNALVFFYPLAGRLKRDEDGRIAIDCNGEGALFLEAHTDSVMDDYGDFAPTMQVFQLGPQIDSSSSTDISSYPLLLAQVTYFKCGGVSLMVRIHHNVADGTASFNFINTWSELARGQLNPTTLPSIDRTPLQARNPHTSSFDHVEFQPPPSLKTPQLDNGSTTISIFNISREQIHLLKAQTKQESGATYTTYETLAAQVWRCVCKARDLTDDQESKLYVPVNGRSRLRPALAPGYFGNALFTATPVAVFGELKSRPLADIAGIVHKELERMDEEYLRSAVDYLEQMGDNMEKAMVGAETFRSPNLRITSWNWLPIYDADFGWGRPIFSGMGFIPFEGMCFVIPSDGKGSFSLAISLQSHHMVRFRKFLYEF